MTAPLLIRWTFGEWVDKPIHPQMYSLQAASCMWARAVWPEADLVICTNNLSEVSQTALDGIARHVGVELISAEPWMPEEFPEREARGKQMPNFRNTWWKFAPFRVDVDAWELVLDNDVGIWREPPSVKLWRSTPDCVLMEGEWPTERDVPWDVLPKLSYGNYRADVMEGRPDLSITTGLMGWPPGLTGTDLPHPLAEAKVKPHYYSNDSGFAAVNWLRWPESARALVSWREVPPIDGSYKVTWADLRSRHCGAHWSSHNIGRCVEWQERHMEEAIPDALSAFASARPRSAPRSGTERRRGLLGASR